MVESGLTKKVDNGALCWNDVTDNEDLPAIKNISNQIYIICPFMSY